MRIWIPGLQKGANRLGLEKHEEQFPEQEFRLVEPLEIEGIADLGENALFVNLQVRAVVALTCGRCLKDYVHTTQTGTAVVFVWKGKEKRPHDEYSIQYIAPGTRTVDLTEAIRETIILNLPMKPICKETCKGLCPQCGADLNTTTCRCTNAAPGPRWKELSELRALMNRKR